MDFILVLSFLGGARNANCKVLKNVGGIHCEGGKGDCCLDAWHDVGMVEVGTPNVEFAVVWGNRESRLGYLSLVNSQTPEKEKFNVGVDLLFVEILVLVVDVYKLLLSCPACKDKEDCIAEERSREEAPESVKVDDASGVVRSCGGEGGQVINCKVSINILDGGDNLLDGEKRCLVVDNDGDGYRACPDKASNSVIWGNRESCLGYHSLGDSQTPEKEKFNVGVDVLFVEILVLVVDVYKLLLSCPACKDKEDCIAEERSREEAPESVKVDDAGGVVRSCSGEGGQVVNCEASIDILDDGDNLLDGENRCLLVDNDGDGYRACPDEASDFVCWAEEGPSNVVGRWRMVIPLVLFATRMTLKG